MTINNTINNNNGNDSNGSEELSPLLQCQETEQVQQPPEYNDDNSSVIPKYNELGLNRIKVDVNGEKKYLIFKGLTNEQFLFIFLIMITGAIYNMIVCIFPIEYDIIINNITNNSITNNSIDNECYNYCNDYGIIKGIVIAHFGFYIILLMLCCSHFEKINGNLLIKNNSLCGLTFIILTGLYILCTLTLIKYVLDINIQNCCIPSLIICMCIANGIICNILSYKINKKLNDSSTIIDIDKYSINNCSRSVVSSEGEDNNL